MSHAKVDGELTRPREGTVQIDLTGLPSGLRLEVWRSSDGCTWRREDRLAIPLTTTGGRATVIDESEGDRELHYRVKAFSPDDAVTSVADLMWMPEAAWKVHYDLVAPAWFGDDDA
jgi:hypothetical protein